MRVVVRCYFWTPLHTIAYREIPVAAKTIASRNDNSQGISLVGWVLTFLPPVYHRMLSEQIRSVPTLLLWGDADLVSPVAVGKAVVKSLLRRQPLHLSGADHNLAQTHTGAVAAEIGFVATASEDSSLAGTSKRFLNAPIRLNSPLRLQDRALSGQ